MIRLTPRPMCPTLPRSNRTDPRMRKEARSENRPETRNQSPRLAPPPAAEAIRNLVERILCELAKRREFLFVTLDPFDGGWSIHVQCHESDMGRILGTGGKRYDALLEVVKALGVRAKLRMLLPRYQPPVTQPMGPSYMFEPAEAQDRVTRLVLDLLKALDDGTGTVGVTKAGIDLSFDLRTEEPELWELILEHVSTIFKAIGFGTGLNLSLRVLPLEPEPTP